MSTTTLDIPRAHSLSQGWIIGKRDDLTWFIGGSLIGLMVLASAVSLGKTPGPIAVLWSILLNAPHVYSTATRVLFDRNERRRVGYLWLTLIPLTILGPALNYAAGAGAAYMVIVTWGHFHIARQHHGFVMLYRAKAREREGLNLDKKFTVYSLMLPLFYYTTALFVSNGPLTLLVFLFVSLALTAFYTWNQIGKAKQNWPKLLLLTANVSLTWAAFIYAASDTSSFGRLAVAVIVTNIPHSLQYLKLMWFHNHNRYAETSGLLGLVSRNWIWFFLAAFVISLPSHLLSALSEWTAALSLGFLFFHYTVDAKIWKVRGDKELALALKL